jgi:hypothetical protein
MQRSGAAAEWRRNLEAGEIRTRAARLEQECYGCLMTERPTQLDKFKEAARQLATDDDSERFKERLRKIVKHRPVPEKA